MNQRLNIEIIKDDMILANSCYYCDGFTLPAAHRVNDILNNYKFLKNRYENNDILLAIRMLESSGARLQPSEYDFIKENNLFQGEEFESTINGNTGLIAISEKEMYNLRNCEEERVEMYLDNEMVGFKIIYKMNGDEYEEYLLDLEIEDEDLQYDNLPILDIDFEIPFCKFKDVFGGIKNVNYDSFKDTEGYVYQLVLK